VIFQDIFIYPYVAEHVMGHGEALVHQLQFREKNVFKKLEVPVVAVRHIAAKHRDFRLCIHDPVAVAPHYFPDVRVLFVRHDAGAGRKFIRE